jgi:hypothetical protein
MKVYLQEKHQEGILFYSQFVFLAIIAALAVTIAASTWQHITKPGSSFSNALNAGLEKRAFKAAAGSDTIDLAGTASLAR